MRKPYYHYLRRPAPLGYRIMISAYMFFAHMRDWDNETFKPIRWWKKYAVRTVKWLMSKLYCDISLVIRLENRARAAGYGDVYSYYERCSLQSKFIDSHYYEYHNAHLGHGTSADNFKDPANVRYRDPNSKVDNDRTARLNRIMIESFRIKF